MDKRFIIQIDFDGTITEKDVSTILLDHFAQGEWRQLLTQYRNGQLTVDQLNIQAFSMVKASKEALIQTARKEATIRNGFPQLVSYVRENNIPMVIVSYGLDIYIRALLRDQNADSFPFHAAQTQYHPQGWRLHYTDPEGKPLKGNMKEKHTLNFIRQGYKVIYIGNGKSDINPLHHAFLGFATGKLARYCQKKNLDCLPFDDFFEVMKVLQTQLF